ncbi:MAG TPA: hypothetical protein VFH51_15165, partial [Myxococcota bacterium]|nr:hypothetical protein [Myxococcota bacterium]
VVVMAETPGAPKLIFLALMRMSSWIPMVLAGALQLAGFVWVSRYGVEPLKGQYGVVISSLALAVVFIALRLGTDWLLGRWRQAMTKSVTSPLTRPS